MSEDKRIKKIIDDRKMFHRNNLIRDKNKQPTGIIPVDPGVDDFINAIAKEIETDPSLKKEDDEMALAGKIDNLFKQKIEELKK